MVTAMISTKKWLDKHASSEGAVSIIGSHTITEEDRKNLIFGKNEWP